MEKKVPMNTLVCSFVHAVHLLSFLRRSDPFRGITSPWRAILGWAKATFLFVVATAYTEIQYCGYW